MEQVDAPLVSAKVKDCTLDRPTQSLLKLIFDNDMFRDAMKSMEIGMYVHNLFIHPSIYLSIYLFVYPLIYISIHLSIHLYISIHLSIHLYISIHLSIHLYISIHMSIHLYISIHMSIHLYISIHLSIHLYISIHLSIHLYIYNSDTKKMPLGKLSKAQIAKGFEVSTNN